MPEFLQELERGGARTLYEQLIDRLRDQISARFKPGERLPTEEDLVQLFSVSRSTVRRAVLQLADEGVLVRRQGKGTYLAQPAPKIIHSIDRLAPFIETFEKAGESVHMRVVDFAMVEQPVLPKHLPDWRNPSLGVSILFSSREVPHAIGRVYLPEPIGRRITRDDVDTTPLYSILQRKLGITLASSEYFVSCQTGSADVCGLLEVSQSSSILVLERITYDESGRAVETTTHYLRPDVYKLTVKVPNSAARA